MGLDMYAYVGRAGQNEQYWNEYDLPGDEQVTPRPVEIAYWRKHPNLHGWMEQLWIRKVNESGGVIVENPEWGSSFNGVELELTLEDLDALEDAVRGGKLPSTQGFFFGSNADSHYKADDLNFIKQAREEIANGNCVFYNSSW